MTDAELIVALRRAHAPDLPMVPDRLCHDAADRIEALLRDGPIDYFGWTTTQGESVKCTMRQAFDAACTAAGAEARFANEQKARAEKAEADARRYLWLRDADQLATKCVYLTYSREELDASIDAAIAANPATPRPEQT